AAIATHLAHQVQAIPDLQPAVGVHQVGHRGQLGQGRKRHPWRLVAAREALMRTLMVVMLRKRSRDLAYLRDAAWPVHGQAFLLVGAMVALDEPVLLGVLRVAQQHADAQTLTEAYQ